MDKYRFKNDKWKNGDIYFGSFRHVETEKKGKKKELKKKKKTNQNKKKKKKSAININGNRNAMQEFLLWWKQVHDLELSLWQRRFRPVS